jgi:hypothetical protein
MKIVRKSDNTKFGILEHGYVFSFEGFAYIKIFGGKEGSAVNLEDGGIIHFNDDDLVTPHPDAFMTLK